MAMQTVTTPESAPSPVRGDQPTLARYFGGTGWGMVVMGLVIVFANRTAETPRLFSEGWGWLFVLVGLTAALAHAAAETDLLVRRLIGLVGSLLVFVGVVLGMVMSGRGRSWALGLIPALPGVALIALFLRRETDAVLRSRGTLAFGIVGWLLAALGVVGTIAAPHLLPGWFAPLMVLGFLLVLGYLGLSGVTSDQAFLVARGLGALGAIAILYALLRSIVPTLLYEWRNPSELEHKITLASGLSLLILGVLGRTVWGQPRDLSLPTHHPNTARVSGNWAMLIGAFLIVLGLLRLFAPEILQKVEWGSEPPRPYLVPTGFVLIAAGLLDVLVAIGFLSENRLVVLTRRELMAFFVSPIAYCVMAGYVFIATPSYFLFLEDLLIRAERGIPREEPIVQGYVIAFLPVVAVLLSVPLITMRLFAEEKRTGTLEVLLTAPVNDWLIVLSKFLAAWGFFILLWLPWWLYLLALRLEGGQEFDFRPMIGFSVALLACGAAFVAMGMFFSSLTRDQIISAALSLMGMMILVGFFFIERNLRGASSAVVTAKSIMRAMSFIHMWIEATDGKLYVRDIAVQLAQAIFWIAATIKVLEARRWS
jgi:ABC-type transport system involved in multi-copper enzyme maturation permease subunit